MAVTFFSKKVGQVTAFTDPAIPARTLVRMESWGGYTTLKAMLTQMTISSQANLQFLHTLGGNIYVYVFGDKIGQMAINGLAFDSTCDSPAGQIGMELVANFYNQQRAANRRVPIKITLGLATTFTAYLVGLDAQIADPKTRIYEFSFKLAVIPTAKRKRSLADRPASGTGEPGTGLVDDDSGGGGDVRPGYPDIPEFVVDDDGNIVPLDPGGADLAVSSTTPVPAGDGFSQVGTGPNTQLVVSKV